MDGWHCKTNPSRYDGRVFKKRCRQHLAEICAPERIFLIVAQCLPEADGIECRFINPSEARIRSLPAIRDSCTSWANVRLNSERGGEGGLARRSGSNDASTKTRFQENHVVTPDSSSSFSRHHRGRALSLRCVTN